MLFNIVRYSFNVDMEEFRSSNNLFYWIISYGEVILKHMAFYGLG